MIIGILFIMAGVMIELYPPLLSMIVAAIFLFVGISLISISYHYKRLSQRVNNPYVDFFFCF